ncbi:MAG: multicopper oxidase domain-containing protein [Elusimicrobia bacterium]|nr:multicopper oxidase domain-containing protein [Elusimicrobiota bacterium]
MKNPLRTLFVLVCAAASASPAAAAVVRYDLTIATKTVDFAGGPAAALAIDGSIPGPVLRFREGDTAVIRLRNALPRGATSLHWHGLLVPNAMDGVPGLTYPPVLPGETFTYRFPVRQAGTYWYHSHTGMDEQRGLYGAIVIAPKAPSRFRPDVDVPVVLSDWTNESPDAVMHMLKRGDEWYSIEKGTAQSLWGAWRRGELGAYFARELLRMPAMDDSDVHYDRFLANGRARLRVEAKPGSLVRLRLVDGAASTFFYLQYAGGPMTIVSADGQPVEPVDQDRFLIAIAETYDVLVRVPKSGGSYELRATAQDGSGHASIWVGAGERHPAPDVPRPDLYHSMGTPTLAQVFALTPAGTMGMSDRDVRAGKFDRPGMAGTTGMKGMSGMTGMSGMAGMQDMGGMSGMQGMSGMAGMSGMETAPAGEPAGFAVDGSAERPFPPYAVLRATASTVLPAGRPRRTYRLTLDGDMTRYVWMIGGKTLSPRDALVVRRGETVRFILINRTMMHHPMHLHGHFFRVLNGQGDFSPLKHTVDVPPMSTTVIEFPADADGDWFFHCHVLYHMMSGMARVVHYEGFEPDAATRAARRGFYRDPYYVFGRADALSNRTEESLTAANSFNIFRARWENGWSRGARPGWEGLATYGRYVDRFLTVFAGADFDKDKRFQSDPAEKNGVAGLDYELPFSIGARLWADTSGGGRATLERTFQLTARLDLDGEAEYDTRDLWVGRALLGCRVSRRLSVEADWDSQFGWGGGLRLRL